MLKIGTHDCKLPAVLDYTSAVRRSPFQLKERWIRWCSIHRNTPKCNRYMDSTADVIAERRRQSHLKNWWVIHPFGYMRFLWDSVVMTITYLIAFVTIPFMISFIVMDYERLALDKVNIPIYLICWLDIFFNCITGYYDKAKRSVVLQIRTIIKMYLKGYLLLDVLSSLPYDRITLPWRRTPGDDSNHFVTIINLFPLLKLTRFRTLHINIFHIFSHFEIRTFHYEIVTTLQIGLYLIIWFSCLCYLWPVLILHFFNTQPSDWKDCWMIGIEDQGLMFRVQQAIFIVLENLSASGCGLFLPRTRGHTMLTAVLMMTGRIIECYIIVMFLQIKAGSKSSERYFQEVMSQLVAYTRQKQLPLHMKNRLVMYYRYRFRNTFFREKIILSSLSALLRHEIAMKSCKRLVENVFIFKDIPNNILQTIIQSLKFELYLPDDVIIKADTPGDCMFFLSSGTVSVVTPTGQEMCRLDDGAHFGEVALLMPDHRRVASVIAMNVCEVYRLNRKDFRKCIPVQSTLFEKVERIAIERIKTSVLMEEHHKRIHARASLLHDIAREKIRKESASRTN